MERCNLCPRNCNALRNTGANGFCKVPAQIKIGRYSLHQWEEPCISGTNGSGTIFFSGCNLGCIYCQNSAIAHSGEGKTIDTEELVNIMLYLESRGAHNINLVTPSHYIHILPDALTRAKNKGLSIPVVYNTSSYEKVENLKKLDGLIDIYLPDFKYMNSELAARYSFAPDYPDIAKAAIDEMIRQTGPVSMDDNSRLLKRGVIVRVLVLPLATKNAMKIIKYTFDKYGNSLYISIMNQYTPPKNKLPYNELNRKVTEYEYNKVLDYALSLGITNCYIQDGPTASESFIPEFNNPSHLSFDFHID